MAHSNHERNLSHLLVSSRIFRWTWFYPALSAWQGAQWTTVMERQFFQTPIEHLTNNNTWLRWWWSGAFSSEVTISRTKIRKIGKERNKGSIHWPGQMFIKQASRANRAVNKSPHHSHDECNNMLVSNCYISCSPTLDSVSMYQCITWHGKRYEEEKHETESAGEESARNEINIFSCKCKQSINEAPQSPAICRCICSSCGRKK